MHMMQFNPLYANIDMLTSLVIVVCSFLIYFQTRDLYLLSKHEGIRYFRMAFLFFAAAFIVPLFRIPMRGWQGFGYNYVLHFVMVYLGTMAVLALLMSVIWKKLDGRSLLAPLLMNLAAICVAGLTLFLRMPLLVFLIQVIIFVSVVAISYAENKEKRRTAKLYVLYMIIFLAWLANIAANMTWLVSPEVSSVLNIVSAALFITLAAKVIRKTHPLK